MSSSICENLRNVNPGRTDWKVKVRVIREWRGVGTDGQVFKSFNLLLLDAQNCRMQAFVPTAVTDRIAKTIQVGKIFIIKDFQVKKYTEKDKFRTVQIDKQIVFTMDTKVKEVDETQIFIPNNMFDFFQFEDLKNMATQTQHLIDVVGVIKKKENAVQKENKKGKMQTQMKFKLTDGRNVINITFWDSFAEQFERALTDDLEEPIILIIASGRVSTWHDNIDICNYSPTKVYLNYDHHSVLQLRKMLKTPEFDKGNFTVKNKTFRLCKIDQIKSLGTEDIQDEIICKLTINKVEETKNWKVCICTSCYNETEMENEENLCKHCPRIVGHPLKRFFLSTMASDETGVIQLSLLDREVRTILGKNVLEVEIQDASFPSILRTIQANDYTVKLVITDENVKNQKKVYQCTGIFQGHNMEQETEADTETIQRSESSTAQASGSSYHLDNISQLDYEVK